MAARPIPLHAQIDLSRQDSTKFDIRRHQCRPYTACPHFEQKRLLTIFGVEQKRHILRGNPHLVQ